MGERSLEHDREIPGETKPVIVIAGPTASGKTAVSLELAERIPAEIVSADSRQLYRFMDIGTAKPTHEELEKVPHHFINIINPDEYYSAGIYGNDSEEAITDIFSRGKIPIITGGTGLYIRALFEGFFSETVTDNAGRLEKRQELEIRYRQKGIETIINELKEVDPQAIELYPDSNPRRLIRALEYYHTSGGKRFSESLKKPGDTKKYTPIYFGIDMDREALYGRINLRVEMMWKAGLPDEVKNLLEKGYSPDLNSLNTVGYKESIRYLKGELTEQEAIEKIKLNTRHYAKRQMTWFNQVHKMQWLSGNSLEIALKIIERYYN